MRRTILPLLLALAGCTPMQWVRQDQAVSPEQLRQDLAQCRQDAWREAQWRSFMYRPFASTVMVDRFGRRFVSPYSGFGDPFGDAFVEESRLTHFCMRAKGYDLAPVEPEK
jgi:hypothetical protein